MGKGDKKTKKGKIHIGTFGVKRARKKAKKTSAAKPGKKASAKKSSKKSK